MDFEDAAKRACETKFEDAKSTYPRPDEDQLPYLCMDLVYQFTLLVDGFGNRLFLLLAVDESLYSYYEVQMSHFFKFMKN